MSKSTNMVAYFD